jgi:high-affinity iron transporter
MIASFFLALREGLEAALIISVLLGSLRKVDRPEEGKTIWTGTITAVLASILVGVLLNLLGARFEGRAEEIFEGITMLLAAGVLTWVLLWMREYSRKMNEQLQSDVKQAVLQNNRWALFSIAFLAVIREGVELAFFLTAAAVDTDGTTVLIGAALGLGAVLLISVLLFRSLIQLNISRFFQVTSLILILFAAGLVAHGVHEFNEVGLIPPIIEHVWDINYLLDENSTLGQLLKALLGYNGNPSLSEVLSYLLYFGLLGRLGFFSSGRKSKIRSGSSEI